MQVSNITKEEQLRGIISSRISSGHYPENGKIDSIRDLAEEFKVSKPTMGLVISNLVTQGILKTEQGRGTFVTSRSQRNVFTTLAGVLMATSGDLYGDMAEAVVQQLQASQRSQLLSGNRMLSLQQFCSFHSILTPTSLALAPASLCVVLNYSVSHTHKKYQAAH